MKPWERLGETTTPDGTALTLTRRDTEYVITAGGQSLMSSRMHGSEEALATFTCTGLRSAEAPCVLVGGLGMGFTLRATLDLLPSTATVVVAEVSSEVVEWNRGPLGPLAGHPITDPRVRVEVRDVLATVRANAGRFDAVLLDVDNGPDALFTSGNGALYDDVGLVAMRTSLKFGGVLAVWSAWEDRKFQHRLRHAGFMVKVERVRARLVHGGPKRSIFLARNGEA